MYKKDDKVLIQFIYKNNVIKTLKVRPDYAKELEILATTKVPRRLIKTILRIGKVIFGHEGEINKNDVLNPSRSGDIYNALKYLINERIIEKNKKRKTIKVINPEKLNSLLKELKKLLQK